MSLWELYHLLEVLVKLALFYFNIKGVPLNLPYYKSSRYFLWIETSFRES